MLRRVTLVRTDVTAIVVPRSPILVIPMMEELHCSETSVLIRTTRCNILEDSILQIIYTFTETIQLWDKWIGAACKQADWTYKVITPKRWFVLLWYVHLLGAENYTATVLPQNEAKRDLKLVLTALHKENNYSTEKSKQRCMYRPVPVGLCNPSYTISNCCTHNFTLVAAPLIALLTASTTPMTEGTTEPIHSRLECWNRSTV
jgi:hypothetical protein